MMSGQALLIGFNDTISYSINSKLYDMQTRVVSELFPSFPNSVNELQMCSSILPSAFQSSPRQLTSSHVLVMLTVCKTRCIYLPFLFSASVFLKGNPLVLLSAPVFLLILPLLLANKMHHNAIAARNVDPRVPKLKEKTPVSVHMP
jgi:hypothetical protein